MTAQPLWVRKSDIEMGTSWSVNRGWNKDHRFVVRSREMRGFYAEADLEATGK